MNNNDYRNRQMNKSFQNKNNKVTKGYMPPKQNIGLKPKKRSTEK